MTLNMRQQMGNEEPEFWDYFRESVELNRAHTNNSELYI